MNQSGPNRSSMARTRLSIALAVAGLSACAGTGTPASESSPDLFDNAASEPTERPELTTSIPSVAAPPKSRATTTHVESPTVESPTVDPTVEPADSPPITWPSPRPNGPTTLGRLADSSLNETSGLAVSLSEDRLLWAINDSGQAALLHTVDLSGGSHGQWSVAAENRDWEDLDSGFLDGVPTLVIADTGDNLRQYEQSHLLLITEPDVTAGPSDSPLPVRKLSFRFPDGARDVESVALAENALWLISKEAIKGGVRSAARLYRLDLGAALASPDSVTEAEFTGTLRRARVGLAARLAGAIAGVDLDQPTAFDIDEDRGAAWVLTYQQVQRFDRQGDEPWASTLARRPDAQYWHGLRQAESLAVTRSGLVVYTSEGVSARLEALPPDWR